MIQSAAHRFEIMARGYDPECANPGCAFDIHPFFTSFLDDRSIHN